MQNLPHAKKIRPPYLFIKSICPDHNSRRYQHFYKVASITYSLPDNYVLHVFNALLFSNGSINITRTIAHYNTQIMHIAIYYPHSVEFIHVFNLQQLQSVDLAFSHYFTNLVRITSVQTDPFIKKIMQDYRHRL
jgi:hypothetical protein